MRRSSRTNCLTNRSYYPPPYESRPTLVVPNVHRAYAILNIAITIAHAPQTYPPPPCTCVDQLVLTCVIPFTEYLTGSQAQQTGGDNAVRFQSGNPGRRLGFQLIDGSNCTCMGPSAARCGIRRVKNGMAYVVVRVVQLRAGNALICLS